MTNEGPTGTGEWSVQLDSRSRACVERFRAETVRKMLDTEFEEPRFMVWWDLVGQVLDKPLHRLWGELFEISFAPPDAVPMAAYSWQRFPDCNGLGEVTVESWPEFCAARAREGFPAVKVSMSTYESEDHVEIIHRIRQAVGPMTAIRIDTRNLELPGSAAYSAGSRAATSNTSSSRSIRSYRSDTIPRASPFQRGTRSQADFRLSTTSGKWLS